MYSLNLLPRDPRTFLDRLSHCSIANVHNTAPIPFRVPCAPGYSEKQAMLSLKSSLTTPKHSSTASSSAACTSSFAACRSTVNGDVARPPDKRSAPGDSHQCIRFERMYQVTTVLVCLRLRAKESVLLNTLH